MTPASSARVELLKTPLKVPAMSTPFELVDACKAKRSAEIMLLRQRRRVLPLRLPYSKTSKAELSARMLEASIGIGIRHRRSKIIGLCNAGSLSFPAIREQLICKLHDVALRVSKKSLRMACCVSWSSGGGKDISALTWTKLA